MHRELCGCEERESGRAGAVLLTRAQVRVVVVRTMRLDGEGGGDEVR